MMPLAGDGARPAPTSPSMPVLTGARFPSPHSPVEMCRCGKPWPHPEESKSVPPVEAGEKEIKSDESQ